MRLSELPRFEKAIVQSVQDNEPNDKISRRLRELGFVNGEEVELLARGPVGADPLLIQIGFTRFALRRSEADRIILQNAKIHSAEIGAGEAA